MSDAKIIAITAAVTLIAAIVVVPQERKRREADSLCEAVGGVLIVQEYRPPVCIDAGVVIHTSVEADDE